MKLIPIPGAEIYYDDRFLPPVEATQLFNTLLSKCAWQRHRAHLGIPFLGTKPTMAIPELITHIRGASTTAALDAGVALAKRPRRRDHPRDGLYKLGFAEAGLQRFALQSVSRWQWQRWLHADAEPEMGPVLASISLGAGSLFRLKRENGSVAFSERLPHGSLLVMAGDTQKLLSMRCRRNGA